MDCNVVWGTDKKRGVIVAVERDPESGETSYLVALYGGGEQPTWVPDSQIDSAWPGSVKTRT